jgi:RAT1-interacting protein
MLHIEERESMSKYDFRLNATRRHRLACYYGYKFETLSTVSKPASQISPDDPELKQRRRATVNTNVQYCSVFTTKLNDISLVMGAEVDCCIGK